MLSGVRVSMAQDTIKTVKSRQEIGISFHQPLKIDEPQGSGQLPPDIIVLFNGSDLKGSRFGIGLDYKFNLKNNRDFIFAKAGITQNNRKDQAEQHFDSIYGYQNYTATLDMDLKKTQLNFAVGFGRSFPLTNRFSIDLGLSAVGIFDLKNELKYDYTEYFYFEYYGMTYETKSHYFQEYVKWKHIGISPLIRPVFKISDHLSLSAEAQLMGLFSFTNKKGKVEQSYKHREYDATQEYSNGEDKMEFETTFKGTFFTLSKITPTLRIAFSF